MPQVSGTRERPKHLSHPDLAIREVPSILRPALGNNYQLRWLRTFIQIAPFPSLGDACSTLGLPKATVTHHLLRLEREIGGPLLARALKNRRMEPTELGQRVLAAAVPLAEDLGIPAVAAMPEPPAPRRRRPRKATAVRLRQYPVLLRPAAGTKGGQRRLRRFLEAVRYPSLTAFARTAGLDPSTVTSQISRLEQDLDGQLLIRGGNGHTMRLTELGTKVLAAAQPYADQLGDLHGPRHSPKD